MHLALSKLTVSENFFGGDTFLVVLDFSRM